MNNVMVKRACSVVLLVGVFGAIVSGAAASGGTRQEIVVEETVPALSAPQMETALKPAWQIDRIISSGGKSGLK